jgi:hypothetical protein
MKYGLELDQVYVPADGSRGELVVTGYVYSTDEVIVWDRVQRCARKIDAFKLAKVRYMLKESK